MVLYFGDLMVMPWFLGNPHSPYIHQVLRKGVEEIVAEQIKMNVSGPNRAQQHGTCS